MPPRFPSCAGALAALERGVASLPRGIAGIAAIAWMIVIYVLSSERRDLLPPSVFSHFASNAAHAPLFGVLALLAARATGAARSGFAIAFLYGIADEWHQSFVPGRSTSLLDLATDATGALAALWLVATARLTESAVRWRVAVASVAIGVAAALATLSDG